MKSLAVTGKPLGILVLCSIISAALCISGFLLVFAFVPLWWLRYRRSIRPAIAASCLSLGLVLVWFLTGYMSGQTSAGDLGSFIFLLSSTVGMYAVTIFWLTGAVQGITKQLTIGSLIAAAFGALPIIVFRPEIIAGLQLVIGPLYGSLGLQAPDAKTAELFGDLIGVSTPLTILGISGMNRQFIRSLLHRESAAIPALSRFRLPAVMVWVFSAAVAGFAAMQLAVVPNQLRMVVYVAAGVVTFLYLLQGVGILQHLFVRRSWTGPARVLPIAILLGFVLHPIVGIALYGLLALFGVSETWFAYRASVSNNDKETFTT